MPEPWDYLIITAANQFQAAAYQAQIDLRRRVGQLGQVRHVLVVPDIDGKRIGSGGSTVECLRRIVELERASSSRPAASPQAILGDCRILILHAGGDSRRLPAYSACGKIFVPLPVESYSALGTTLFDRLVQAFFHVPCAPQGAGQVVVASGDALIHFDASALDFSRPGMTVLGTSTTPQEASRHGVFAPGGDGAVRLYLQKPSIADQTAAGAIDPHGQTVLDIGVMSFDAGAAACLLDTFCVIDGPEGETIDRQATPGHTTDSHITDGGILWKADLKRALLEHGIDLYREICCALGTQSSLEHYEKAVRSSGSRLDKPLLASLYAALKWIPLNLQVLEECGFLHFGATRQLISSGVALIMQDKGAPPGSTILSMNNAVTRAGMIAGSDAWVEGARVTAPLELAGQNVVVGVDVSAPLALPPEACLDVSQGSDRTGKTVWFVRCYGIDDTFKHSAAQGGKFCGKPIAEWLSAVGAAPADLWPADTKSEDQTLWTARVSPSETENEGYRRWLWMFHVDHATAAEKLDFLAADRYSASEVATLVDQTSFYRIRAAARAMEIQQSLARMFAPESNFSAQDLAFALQHSEDPALLVASLLTLAHERSGAGETTNYVGATFERIAHCLASALDEMAPGATTELESMIPGLADRLPPEVQAWANALQLSTPKGRTAHSWTARLRERALSQP